jgi:hypothetical protein
MGDQGPSKHRKGKADRDEEQSGRTGEEALSKSMSTISGWGRSIISIIEEKI